jgi:hypothetical protein
MTDQALNPLGIRVRDSILDAHENWVAYVSVLPTGDLELAVPAPRGSRAGHLVIFTAGGEDTWIRYSPPRACYSVGSDSEMHAVIEALLADEAVFVVVTDGDEWVETSLLRPGEEAVLIDGQVASFVSWSGRNDKVVSYMNKSSPRGA